MPRPEPAKEDSKLVGLFAPVPPPVETLESGEIQSVFFSALGSLEHAGMRLVETEIALGRELGLPMSFHQNPAGQIRELHEAKLLGGDLLPVHANLATDDELELLAACGAGISFTVEGEFGGGRAMKRSRARRARDAHWRMRTGAGSDFRPGRRPAPAPPPLP